MKREKFISIAMLLFAIGFNLWLYRAEPTAKVDPNDNTFQYALVDRTNKVWDYATKECSKKIDTHNLLAPRSPAELQRSGGAVGSFVICHLSFMVDHWVPNWAQGYNLPYYYSHIPQIAIVASWRFFDLLIRLFGYSFISLFTYYHLIIYLLLCFFPLSVFLALRVIRLSWLTAGIGALLATHISTDGLYGLDPASFLWRGYGLSSQLFAMIWLPLAIAYAYRLLSYESEKGGGRQFLRELTIRLIPWKKTVQKDRHLASENSQNVTEASQRASRKNSSTDFLIPAVFFLAATTAGHLGIGIIAFLSIGLIAFAPVLVTLLTHLPNPLNHSTYLNLVGKVKDEFLSQSIKLLVIFGGALVLVGYWILPILLHGNYHNISFWDPVWKFDSYGAIPTLTRLFNGELFDFGRFPILTALIFVGLFTMNREPFTLLFIFWLLLYFGRTTWGGLIDLIPGMRDFHLSRFIVGLHMAGLFLAPMGVEWLVEKIKQYIRLPARHRYAQALAGGFVYLIIGLFVYLIITPQSIRYSQYNDVLIKQANENYDKQIADANTLVTTLQRYFVTMPGRVYAGRAGWGKDFRIAETPYNMYLSTYGIPTVLWLPQTWSPNSDTEQYFSEDQSRDYTLYNIRYVATPPTLPPQPFWKKIKETSSWILYSVSSVVIPGLTRNPSLEENTGSRLGGRDDNNGEGYITTGVRPAIVSTKKELFINLVRLWIQSEYPKQGLYPELTFDKNYPKTTGLPNFKMLDEITYQVPDGSTHNLFSEPPLYLSLLSDLSILSDLQVTSQSQDSDMIFRASVDVPAGCVECLVILRQTFHPSWRATIDGKPAQTLTVFPFYTAIKLDSAGTHEVIFSYKPSGLKKVLLFSSLITLISVGALTLTTALRRRGTS